MFYAHISPRSPRYRDWLEVVGADSVPIQSITTHLASAPGHEHGAEFYLLDLAALTRPQIERLTAFLSRRFAIAEEDVKHELAAGCGVPILADDVIITCDARHFL